MGGGVSVRCADVAGFVLKRATTADLVLPAKEAHRERIYVSPDIGGWSFEGKGTQARMGESLRPIARAEELPAALLRGLVTRLARRRAAATPTQAQPGNQGKLPEDQQQERREN
jgi:hypothetical protein